MKLLLASKSAARHRMLEAAGVRFEVIASDLDEEAAKAGIRGAAADAATLARALAAAKARAASAPEAALVIGSDQTLERDDGTMLDKPTSRANAAEQLRSLSGRTHRLHSAAAIFAGGDLIWEALESVAMTMRPISDAFLDDYLDREYEAIRWGVGGYRIEGPGVQLFDRIEGSHFAILGMPLLPLLTFLRTRGEVPS